MSSSSAEGCAVEVSEEWADETCWNQGLVTYETVLNFMKVNESCAKRIIEKLESHISSIIYYGYRTDFEDFAKSESLDSAHASLSQMIVSD